MYLRRRRGEDESKSELSESLDDDGQLDTEFDSLSRDLPTLFLITREAYSRELGRRLFDIALPDGRIGDLRE